MSVVLETVRTRVRHFTPEDAPFALELLNEPAFLRNIGDKGVRDLEGARAYIEGGPLAMVAEHGVGLHVVAARATGEPLGMCGLLVRDGLEDPDIGFAFLARHRRKGFGFEAASAVLRHASEELGFNRVVAIAALDNEASAALLARLGLFPSGTIRLPGDTRDSVLFTPERIGGKRGLSIA